MSGEESGEGFIVKLRGLPWSATPDDIDKFLGEAKILNGKDGVHLTQSREGRPSGEAFVELESEEDMNIALGKDKDHMGSRYIEVFKVNRAEMEWVVKRSVSDFSGSDGCVRIRGLPFGCSKEEIAQFFAGMQIVPNGITLLTDYTGRSTGEAYVQFINGDVAERALQKHREKIGHRYIEVFRSSLSEVNSALRAMGPMSGPLGGGRGGMGRPPVPPGPMGGGGMFGGASRPSPYDRGFGGGGPVSRFPQRNVRSFKGPGGGWNDNGAPGRGGMRGGAGGGGGGGFDMNPWGSGAGGNMGGGGGGQHCIHMRGLPFKATENDIAEFFKPIVPADIYLLTDNSGRASGEAEVEFATHDDALKAMNKDRSNMNHRYIELFLNSANGSFGARGGGRF